MTTQAKILIVDDDPRICRLLRAYLEAEGYHVRTAGSGREMRRMLIENEPDLVLLDVLLPDVDGFSLAAELRTQSNTGIIMLTGKGDQIDKVVGLEVGADDYVTKPFEERELLARMRSVLRRTTAVIDSTPANFRKIAIFMGWRLDLDGHDLLSLSGESVYLTSHEFLLLSSLVTRQKRVVSRDQLLDLIADREGGPFDRSIDVLVGKLRRKIEPDPKRPQIIKTIRGAGYKFSVDVAFENI